MTAKKPSVSGKKELKTTITKLRSKLDRADRAAQRLTSKAALLKKTNAELEAQVKNLKRTIKHLNRAPRAFEPRKVLASDRASATHAPSPTVTSPTVSADASWTVVQLRAEARSRGVTGFSRKTKAELLAALP